MKKLILFLCITFLSSLLFASDDNDLLKKPNGVKIYEGIYLRDSPRGNPICEIIPNVVCCIVVTPNSGANPYIEIYSGPVIIKTIQNATIESTEDNEDGSYECIVSYY
ncbi:MAG: hypothetical protein ACK4K9_11540 [Bacteroidia bacterium]